MRADIKEEAGGRPLRIAFITTDNRDAHRSYGEREPRFGPAPAALIQGFRSLGGKLEIHVISCTQQPMASPEKLADHIFFHSIHVPKWGWLRSGYLGCVRALRRKMREIEPDVVHGQGTERECALGAVYSGFPNVVTIHGNMQGMAAVTRGLYRRVFYGAQALLEALALSQTWGVLCNSTYTEHLVQRWNRKTWRVANALRPEFFRAYERCSGAGLPLLLCIGTVASHKRPLELVQAVSRRFPQGPPFRLVFMGDSNPGDAYNEAFQEACRQTKGVSYVGQLGPEEICGWMAQARGLVHVSREEAFGLVLAEAMAMGLAVFCFRVGGAPDVVAGMDQAWVERNGDWDGLMSALEQWVAAGGSMSSNARDLAENRYRPEVIAQIHEKIYHQVASRPYQA